MVKLILKGVKQNNLKDIDLEIPLGKAVVVTGPSGSGKSSLAFETIYAEGQRRYMQSLSTYARQFLERFRAPIAEQIKNIPPTIALEQINPVRNSRATVGTSTEIYDYLRLLFEKIGVQYCETCDLPMKRHSHQEIFLDLVSKYTEKALVVAYSGKTPSKGVADYLRELLRSGYSRIIIGTEVQTIEEILEKKGLSSKPVSIIVDRIRMPKAEESPSIQTRLTESMRSAVEKSKDGEAEIYLQEGDQYIRAETVTTLSRCPKCHAKAQPKSAISFSFNSPLGACEKCKGFGNTLDVDENLIIPNSRLTLAQGAIDPFTKPSMAKWQKKLLEFCKAARIDPDLPFQDLPEKHQKMVFDGDKKFKGVRGVFAMLETEKYKMRIRVFVSRYTSPFTCQTCRGSRLNDSALRVKVDGKNISQMCEMNLEQIHQFLKNLSLDARQTEIIVDIIRQLDRRFDYLCTVGLGYLTLARLTRSLSGGEYQRILLATQLSQGLTDTLYVLDEPSIGLHPKDTDQLLKVLGRLLDLGNSLLLVEHDPEVIDWGQYIIDMGPGSGSRGGEVIFAGSHEMFKLSESRTAVAIRSWKEQCRSLLKTTHVFDPENQLEIGGAQGNNLKNLTVNIPLNRIVAITGVSGSGKSTLIVDTVYQALSKIFFGRSENIAKFETIRGFEKLASVQLVDQSPIGKSSRSNPITFLKAYDEIRSLFAQTPEAVARKYAPGHFSFNVEGGRCDTCEGEGRIKVDMVFMEDVWVPCQVCDERRFKPTILAIRYRGKNIDDVLRMTVDEAHEFFKHISTLKSKLALLQQVGLGYVQLGQPGYTLSGGEAQRLKIARELSGTSTLHSPTLFILDEPTTGLHFDEITKLIQVLQQLIRAGHSVLVIEHNLQMICAADYVIDLGPDGGDRGGELIATGTPYELAQKRAPYTGVYLAELLGDSKL